MGFFKKLFEKKNCDICGGEIGLLGNRKLEDGNLCKNCASQLSPWFEEHRSSTVEQIREQLAYREANKEAVAAFNTTRVLGRHGYMLYLDEDAGKFLLSRSENFETNNPDVLDFSQVTGCELDINEHRQEKYRVDGEGKQVSFEPKRYVYSYDFHITIRVNHPYFDDISFDLNGSDVEINPDYALPLMSKPDPQQSLEYCEYVSLGKEIRSILTQSRVEAREKAAKAAAPKQACTCPWCGATTTPDEHGCCEYCGGSVNA